MTRVIFAVLLAFFSTFAAAEDKLHINSAEAEAIAASLHGVGMKKAEAIVKYRELNGPFQSIEQLAEVSGIGVKTLEKIELGEVEVVVDLPPR